LLKKNFVPENLKAQKTAMKLKILVIEDNDELRAIVAELLEYENFDAVVAADGYEGIELALSKFPDLILCDLMMPGLNGYEVMSQLRQHSSTASIPFVYLTAQSDLTDLNLRIAFTREDYLTKPFTREQIKKAINKKLSPWKI
jgi:CheY-like chemotaxis protein